MRYIPFIAVLFILTSCAGNPKRNGPSLDQDMIAQQDVGIMQIDDIRKLANQGNPDAIHELCYRTIYGYGGAVKNYEEAYQWCQKGAQTGNNSSQTLLAELYLHGNYVKQDYSKAFQLYKSAAMSGHRHAQFILYFMYSKGHGTDKDDELAQFWLNQSASSGYKHAIKLRDQLKTEKRDKERYLKKSE